MSRKPLVNVNRVMLNTATTWHDEIRPETMRAVLEKVVTKYEAALDGAHKKATFCEAMRDEIMALRDENDELRERTTATLQTGLDAAIADGDVLDEWKERAWQAEKRIADLEESFAAAERKRGMKAASNAADRDTTLRRIDELIDRVAQLERTQRKEQGEL